MRYRDHGMGFQLHLHPPVWQGYKTLNGVQDLVGPAPSVDGYKQDHDIFCDVFFCGFEDVEKVSSIVVRNPQGAEGHMGSVAPLLCRKGPETKATESRMRKVGD